MSKINVEENKKWEAIYDDPEQIELLKREGETPESSSGMSTKEIEILVKEKELKELQGDPFPTDAIGAILAFGAVCVYGIIVGVKKLLDKAKNDET